MLGSGGCLLVLLLLPGLAAGQTGTEILIPDGTRIQLQLNDYLSTKVSTEGENFTATVSAPVYFRDRIIIPKGSIVSGIISRLVRPGRFRGKAVMNLLFNTIRFPGATETLPIVATLASVDPNGNGGTQEEGTISAEGSKGQDAAKIITPSLGGAGIGGIVSGGKGAAIGAGIGAAVGLGRVLAEKGKDLEVKRGCAMEIVLDRPLNVPAEIVRRNEQEAAK